MIEEDAGESSFEMAAGIGRAPFSRIWEYEAQLIAINALLERNDEAEMQVAAEMQELDETCVKD